MKEYLQKIKEIPGVIAVHVFNNRAETLFQLGNEKLGKKETEALAIDTLQLLASYIAKGYPVGDSDFIFQNGRLLYFNYDKLNIFVHCDTNVKISMLRMTVNVVMLEALEDKKVKKIIEKNIIDGSLLLRGNKITEDEKPYIDKILQS